MKNLMSGTGRGSITEKRSRRRTWKLVVSGLSAVAVIATMYAVMLPAQTLEPKLACGLEQHVHGEACYAEVKKPICGLTESEGDAGHTHTEACYENVLVCTLPEGEEHTHGEDCYTKTLVCKLGETPAAEGHKHTEECYEITRELICKLPEHTHTTVCYVHGDPQADVETSDLWGSEISAIRFTGDKAADAVLIARSQLGKGQSVRNWIEDEAGNRSGWNRFGALFGEPYGDMGVNFAKFVYAYAGIDLPGVYDAADLYQMSNSGGRLTDSPKAGDLVFFRNAVNEISSAGVVSEIDADADGNVSSYLAVDVTGGVASENRYAAGDSAVAGFARWIKEVKPAAVVEKTNESETLPQETLTPEGDPAAEGTPAPEGTLPPEGVVTPEGTPAPEGTLPSEGVVTPEGTPAPEGAVTPGKLLDVPMPAAEFKLPVEVSGKVITVIVNADVDTLPEGTEMLLAPVDGESVRAAVEGAVQGNADSIYAVDISFIYKGEPIEPLLPVRVRMISDAIQEMDEATVVHISDEGDATRVEQVPELIPSDQVLFDADSFSKYAIAGKSNKGAASGGVALTTAVHSLTTVSDSLTVTVEFADMESVPSNARLIVKEIGYEGEGWFNRSVRLADVLYNKYGNVTMSDCRMLELSITTDLGEYKLSYPLKGITIAYDMPLSTVDNTIEPFYDEDGIELPLPPKEGHLEVVHYAAAGPEFLPAEMLTGEGGIVQTIVNSTTLSDFDIVYVYEYESLEAGADYNPETAGTITAERVNDLITGGTKAGGGTLKALAPLSEELVRSAGQIPAHEKSIGDNGNGTYTIGLNVTGDADSESNTASNANVVIVYDVSLSMTGNYIPSATGAQGIQYASNFDGVSDGTYFQLYKQTGSNSYAAITDAEAYTGTVYRRTGSGTWYSPYQYNVYTGQRYHSSITRADAGEKVVNDFVHALFGYQNTDDPTTPENESQNIQAALVTFANSSTTAQGWTSTETAITNRVSGTGTSHKLTYSSATNWESALWQALQLVNSADNDPTYVVLITDGQPTSSNVRVSGTNQYMGTNVSGTFGNTHYGRALNEARALEQALAQESGAFYSIYAYGKAADWLASLTYYAYNGSRPASNIEGTTFDTEGYYNASDTDALTSAINAIFQKIVQTLGVTNVSINDGTTSNVTTSTGIAANLLVVENSYQYWLSLPVVPGSGNTYTFQMPDKYNKNNGNPITYTVTPGSGGNVTISWTTADEGAKSATYAGSVNLNTLTVEWTQATDFYNYAPPAAAHNAATGSVDWDLNSVGTLLDGVTYTVTFDCYPSQYTLDLIADLKNGDIEYVDPTYNDPDTGVPNLDSVIMQYLVAVRDGSGKIIDYQLKTNTTASLNYTDTRPGGTTDSVDYKNPDPRPVGATEAITVSKIWNNTLDSRTGWQKNVELYVTRDGESVHNVSMTEDNNWTNSAYISYGIITTNTDGSINVKAPGHDYSFSEDVDTGHNWEIEVPILRPMLVDNVVTTLRLLETEEELDDIPSALLSSTEANARSGIYYKLTIGNQVKYYIVDNTVVTQLTAINHRRSYLDVVKQVIPSTAPDDAFTFTMTVSDPKAAEADATDVNSDAWVWFSIWDPANNTTLKDPDVATAAGIRWQLSDETVVTSKPVADFNGYFCVPSGTPITVYMKNGYSLRFLNLPEETTYTIVESTTMPSDEYSFVSIAGQRGYDISGVIEYQLDGEGNFVLDGEGNKISINNDWTTETVGTVTGQSITGTIEHSESAYKVTVKNLFSSVQLEKVTKTTTGGETTETKIAGSQFSLKTVNGQSQTPVSLVVKREMTDDTVTTWYSDYAYPGGEFAANNKLNVTKVVQTYQNGTLVSEVSSADQLEITFPNPFNLGGLPVGTYRLVEEQSPDGYNRLANNIDFEVYMDTELNLKRIRLLTSDENVVTLKEEAITETVSGSPVIKGYNYTVTVNNVPGEPLPVTGSIGTPVYYIGGALLMLTAGILLIVRRKKKTV